MVYDLSNNDIHNWAVHLLCDIAPCCRSVHLSLGGLWFTAFSFAGDLHGSRRYRRLFHPLRASVVKSVFTSPFHDWTSGLRRDQANQTHWQKYFFWRSANVEIIDCQMILFSSFAAPLPSFAPDSMLRHVNVISSVWLSAGTNSAAELSYSTNYYCMHIIMHAYTHACWLNVL